MQGKTIRIPVYMIETINKWKKTVANLMQKLGRNPLVEEIAHEMGISEDMFYNFSYVISI